MAYANADDLAGQWHPLSEVERTRATALLDMAAIILRRHVPLDTLDFGDERLTIAKQVSIDMVIDALTPGDYRGRSSYSQTVGGIAESATLLNPSATLVFTEAQKELFGLPSGSQPSWYFGDGGCRDLW